MGTRNLFLSSLLAMALSVAAEAAVIDVYDGDYNIYNPADTYQVHGWISETLFTFGFGFTDPSHGFELNLTAPDGMPGQLEWAITSGPYGTGLSSTYGHILAGESYSGIVGLNGASAPDNITDTWITIANLSIPASDPILFGPGTGTGVTSPVPVPAALWLFLSGLMAMLGLGRSRRSRI